MREPESIFDVIAQMSVIGEGSIAKLDSNRVHGGSDPSRPPAGVNETLAEEAWRRYSNATTTTGRAEAYRIAREELIKARFAPRRSLTPNTLEWRVAIATAEGSVEQISITYGCSRAHVYKLREQFKDSAS